MKKLRKKGKENGREGRWDFSTALASVGKIFPRIEFSKLSINLVTGASLVAQLVKNPPGDPSLVPELGRSLGEGIPKDRGAWQAAVQEAAKSQTGPRVHPSDGAREGEKWGKRSNLTQCLVT